MRILNQERTNDTQKKGNTKAHLPYNTIRRCFVTKAKVASQDADQHIEARQQEVGGVH